MTPSSAPASAPTVLVVCAAATGHTPPAQALGLLPMSRPFAAVEGAVWEGVPADGAAAVAALRLLLRAGVRQVGIGCGPDAAATSPTSGRLRPVRPPAHAAARVALAAAHRTHPGVALRASRGRGRNALAPKTIEDAETCLWLLADLWHRRSSEGWAVADLMDAGLTGRDCARRLDISPSAVSQRASAARYVEGRRAADLAARLLDGLVRYAEGHA